MLNVRTDTCAGCGVCTRICPTGAISLDTGTARIDQGKCIGCYRCVQACPRGAIVGEEVRISPVWELRNSLLRLQAEVQMAAWRLKKLEQRRTVQRK